MKKITVKMLNDANACPEQVAIFKKAFPNGADVNLRNARRAAKLGLNIDWAASHFLSPPASDAYNKAIAPARDAYYKAIATARDAYYKAIATAFVNAWKLMK